jgi:hypothetical protein
MKKIPKNWKKVPFEELLYLIRRQFYFKAAQM